MKPLKGRTALVTGGGRGIGAATAVALARAGVSVAVVARNEEQVVDVAAREAMGRVDILVNNAGTATSGPLAQVTLEEWNHIMAVNVTGTFLFTKALLPDMVEAGWGRVVNVASLAGTGVTVNAICPGYVNTPLTQETVARIVERTGRSYRDALATLLQQTRQYRLIPPTEVADAIVHLCHQESADVNGEAIPMDGGGLDI